MWCMHATSLYLDDFVLFDALLKGPATYARLLVHLVHLGVHVRFVDQLAVLGLEHALEVWRQRGDWRRARGRGRFSVIRWLLCLGSEGRRLGLGAWCGGGRGLGPALRRQPRGRRGRLEISRPPVLRGLGPHVARLLDEHLHLLGQVRHAQRQPEFLDHLGGNALCMEMGKVEEGWV